MNKKQLLLNFLSIVCITQINFHTISLYAANDTTQSIMAGGCYKKQEELSRLQKVKQKMSVAKEKIASGYNKTKQFVIKHHKFILGVAVTCACGAGYILLSQQSPTPATIETFDQLFYNPSTPRVPVNAQHGECSSCFEDFNPAQNALCCGHASCNACLTNIVDLALKEKKLISLRCPTPECKRALNIHDVRMITNNDQKKINQYYLLARKAWIKAQPHRRLCPTSKCDHVFLYNGHRENMTCPDCKQQYCTNCLDKHEQGIICKAKKEIETEEHRKWKKQNNAANCPMCTTLIQKTVGCNHMSCDCGHQFCWLCLGNYDSSGRRGCRSYNCNNSIAGYIINLFSRL